MRALFAILAVVFVCLFLIFWPSNSHDLVGALLAVGFMISAVVCFCTSIVCGLIEKT